MNTTDIDKLIADVLTAAAYRAEMQAKLTPTHAHGETSFLADSAGLLAVEVQRLRSELNNPEIHEFLAGVQREAAHQRERWGSDHDDGKTDADWFWLVGYLVGKALHKPEKRPHHLITAAAALFNWHLKTLGKTNMRPGIADPEVQITADAQPMKAAP